MNKTKLLAIGLSLLCVGFLTIQIIHAQTNPTAPATQGIPDNPTPAWMDKTASDISSVLGDFGVPATPQEIKGLLGLAVAAFFGARLLRKGLPDQWQTGLIGTALKHAALEINPKANAPEQQAAIAGAAPTNIQPTTKPN